MKKILFLAVFISSVLIAKAQNYDNLQTRYVLKKYEDAKTEMDNLDKNPKAQDKPLTNLWRAKVYTALYKADSLRAKYPGAFKTADEAFDKALQNYAQLKEDTSELRGVAIDIYSTAFTLGLADFQKKNWDGAYSNFSTAVKYSDIFLPRKWTTLKQEFDTTAILYSGYAAQNGKNIPAASKAYLRLIDNKVSSFNNGESLVEVYKNILLWFSDAKDSANFYKYYAVAKATYPKEDWELYESDYVNKNYTLLQRINLYDQQKASGTLSENQYMEYGDMFFNLKPDDKSKLDSAQIADLQAKAMDAFKNAYAKNSSNSLAAYNVAIINYSNFLTLDDKTRANIKAMRDINSSKPVEKDPKKKAALDAQYKTKTDPYLKANQDLETPTMDAVNSSIEWGEKAFGILNNKRAAGPLENVEKNVFNRDVDILAVLYGYKRDKVKGKDDKAYSDYDAKFKLYDSLHSSD